MFLLRESRVSTWLTGLTAVACLIASGASAEPKRAPRNPAYVRYMQDPGSVARTFNGHHLGRIPAPADRRHNAGARINLPRQKYDTTYDLRDYGKVSPVRDQGACGSCWTFGAYGSMESLLLPGESLDFSENNMKNEHGYTWTCCAGGNSMIAAGYLVRWGGPVQAGPVAEAEDTYNTSCTSSPASAPLAKHVHQVVFWPERSGPLDNDTTKWVLTNEGAISTSVKAGGGNRCAWNGETSLWCRSKTINDAPDHQVTIVGWDDTYSRNNFAAIQGARPAGDGAFLIKNSWGPGFGLAGYFWVSYYDVWVGYEDLQTFPVMDVSSFDAGYEYDHYGWVWNIGDGVTDTYWGANVFTADSDELVDEVGFYTNTANSTYSVYVYANLTDPNVPNSGVLVRTVSGTLGPYGYHKVDVSDGTKAPIALAAGSDFSVVLRVTGPGTVYPLTFEDNDTGYLTLASASPGQSFYSDDSGSTWGDLYYFDPESNFNIKVYTRFNLTGTLIQNIRAAPAKEGTLVRWTTGTENQTAGFHLLGLDPLTGRYLRLNREMLPALIDSPQGGEYVFLDPRAGALALQNYQIVEVENSGRQVGYGPFQLNLEDDLLPAPFAVPVGTALDSGYRRQARLQPIAQPRIPLRRSGSILAGILKNLPKSRIAGDRLKIFVAREGLVYLDAAAIASGMGLPERKIRQMIAEGSLALTSRGAPVPLLTASDSAGVFFHAIAADSVFTDENVYWLSPGTATPMKVSSRPALFRQRAQSFTDLRHFEEDLIPATGMYDDPRTDFWLWKYLLAGDTQMASAEFKIFADGATGKGPASLAVYLKGGLETEASPDHHAQIELNGVEIGDTRFNGTRDHSAAFDFDGSLLCDGENTVTVRGLLEAGASTSLFFVDGFDLEYRRRFQAFEDTLAFGGESRRGVTITGFAGEDVMVLDVTRAGQPVLHSDTRVEKGPGGWQVSLDRLKPGARYLAARARPPARLTAVQNQDLLHPSNGAGYLVITAGDLLPAAAELAAYRGAQGHSTRVVTVEAIMDVFNHGVYDPWAIRKFLAHAYRHWPEPPGYVVLAGDGSMDTRDLLGAGGNLVPPLLIPTAWGLFSSDPSFGDVDGDGLPEMAVGRLPVKNEAELYAVIDKIVAFESDPQAAWRRNVLLAADDTDRGGNFETSSESLACLVSPDHTISRVYLGQTDLQTAREELRDGIETGTGLLNYLGHAALDHLAQEGLLGIEDLPQLQNPGRTPLLLGMTCVLGRFELAGFDTLAEALVVRPDGGAVGVWSPSGFSQNAHAQFLNEGFFDAVFSKRATTAGQAILQATEAYVASGRPSYLPALYNYLGDPALVIQD